LAGGVQRLRPWVVREGIDVLMMFDRSNTYECQTRLLRARESSSKISRIIKVAVDSGAEGVDVAMVGVEVIEVVEVAGEVEEAEVAGDHGAVAEMQRFRVR
jgi:hypothetical protein